MVGRGGRGVVSELGAWPCGVCSKGVSAKLASGYIMYGIGPHDV